MVKPALRAAVMELYAAELLYLERAFQIDNGFDTKSQSKASVFQGAANEVLYIYIYLYVKQRKAVVMFYNLRIQLIYILG